MPLCRDNCSSKAGRFFDREASACRRTAAHRAPDPWVDHQRILQASLPASPYGLSLTHRSIVVCSARLSASASFVAGVTQADSAAKAALAARPRAAAPTKVRVFGGARSRRSWSASKFGDMFLPFAATVLRLRRLGSDLGRCGLNCPSGLYVAGEPAGLSCCASRKRSRGGASTRSRQVLAVHLERLSPLKGLRINSEVMQRGNLMSRSARWPSAFGRCLQLLWAPLPTYTSPKSCRPASGVQLFVFPLPCLGLRAGSIVPQSTATSPRNQAVGGG